MFVDEEVKVLIISRSGWGSSCILLLLNYNLIWKNFKIIIDYSDIIVLLLVIYFGSGLVIFYGFFVIFIWNKFFVVYFKDILFEEKVMS